MPILDNITINKPVSNNTEKSAIPTNDLSVGCLVFQVDEKAFYFWNGSSWELKETKNNETGSNPTANDDISQGYETFSLWRNTADDSLFVCADNSTGAAVWVHINKDSEAEWGSISGTLSAQTDLQNALDAKEDTVTNLPASKGGTGKNTFVGQAGKVLKVNVAENGYEFAEDSTDVSWGDVTGTLSNQTDLQAALDAKEDSITNLPATKGGTGLNDLTGQSGKILKVKSDASGYEFADDAEGSNDKPDVTYVTIGASGDYSTIESAITAGNYHWKLIEDYTISSDIQLPVPVAGVEEASLYIPNGILLTATASILTGTCRFTIEHANPAWKKIVYTAPATNKYFIMYNAANDEDGDVVIANNLGFDNQSTFSNTGLFGAVEVHSLGKVTCLGANADNAGLTITSKNSFLNQVEVGSRQTDPVNALIVNGKVDQAIVTGTSGFATSINNIIKVEQYGVIRSLKPQGGGGLNVGVSGRVESILNLASFPININVTGNNAYVGNGDLATDGTTDPSASTGAIEFDSGVHYATFENLVNVWGPIGGTDGSDSTGHIYRNCHFSGTNTVFMTDNTLIDKCTHSSGTFKMGNTSLLPGVQPQECTISNCTAAAFEQAEGVGAYKLGNNATIGNTNNQYNFLNKTFSDNNYSANPQDNILWDSAGGVSTINLPDTKKCPNAEVVVMKTDNSINHINLTPQSGQSIVGESVLSTQNDHVRLVSDGNLTWRAFG